MVRILSENERTQLRERLRASASKRSTAYQKGYNVGWCARGPDRDEPHGNPYCTETESDLHYEFEAGYVDARKELMR